MTVTIIQQALPYKWVRLKKYCALTGDTPSGVHARRNKGVWLDGKHTKIGPDGKVWVNLEETDKWVEFGNKAIH